MTKPTNCLIGLLIISVAGAGIAIEPARATVNSTRVQFINLH
jgi:hypothetical protein